MKNKVLILTLGTGHIMQNGVTFDRNNLKEMLQEKQFSYRQATYQLGEFVEGKEITSEFVAEPLLELEKPDKVIILGTVKCQWLHLFLKFFDSSLLESKYGEVKEMAEQLYCIQTENGINTNWKELENIEREILKIFQIGKVFHSYPHLKEIKIILTRYGINQQELDENYNIITKKMEDILVEDKKNEISFDITHSFRSLPIYNLTIFQYFKNITKYHVEITHIYYGNFEVSNENNGKSPLIDLKSLLAIMNLTSGLKEFKNTGNTVTLIQEMEKNNIGKKELIEALKQFDLATQLNGYTEIISSLERLLDIVKKYKDDKNEKGTIVDLSKMLEMVLEESFSDKAFLEEQEYKIAFRQYQLSWWYYKQNRIGLAVATALECLRSYLLPYYIKYSGKECTSSNVENMRKAAIDRLGVMQKNKSDKEIEKNILEMVRHLEISRIEAVNIRNKFAHNLIGESLQEEKNVQWQKEKIEEFLINLQKLMESTKEEKKVFEDLYMRENKNIVSKIKGNNIRIIISNSKVPMGMKKKLENSINKTYQVYQIPFYDRLEKDKKSQTAKLLYNGKLLVEYIKEHFEIEEVNIICYQLSYSQIMHYSILLHNEGVKHVYQFIEEKGNVQPIAKCQYGLLEDEVILTEKDCVYISKTEPLS